MSVINKYLRLVITFALACAVTGISAGYKSTKLFAYLPYDPVPSPTPYPIDEYQRPPQASPAPFPTYTEPPPKPTEYNPQANRTMAPPRPTEYNPQANRTMAPPRPTAYNPPASQTTLPPWLPETIEPYSTAEPSVTILPAEVPEVYYFAPTPAPPRPTPYNPKRSPEARHSRGGLPGTPVIRVLTSTDSIEADWLHVSDDGGSIIKAYYAQLDGGEPQKVFFTPFGSNIIYFRGLQPDTQYTVSVWAENANGAGVPAVKTVRTYDLAYSNQKLSTIAMVINQPTMTVNGQVKQIDEQGTTSFVADRRTMLPVSAIVEAMGGNVQWFPDIQTVVLSKDGVILTLVIGQAAATRNGEIVQLATAPVIVGGRTMLPVSFIAESFGYEVFWDNVTKTVILSK
ncbi:MAG: fibronectin type III domain-containing protein [Clostridiales bacterium]|nr:fibronectin type III domain-containing protein [Clostridiales bacterium]